MLYGISILANEHFGKLKHPQRNMNWYLLPPIVHHSALLLVSKNNEDDDDDDDSV